MSSLVNSASLVVLEKKKNRGHCLKKTEHAFFLVFFFSNKFGFTKNFIMNHIENYLDLVVYTFFG